MPNSNTKLHNRPQPKRKPEVEETEVRVKEEGTEYERNRYIGRSDPAQAKHMRVSIEEPLNIPIRVYQIRDPPLIPRAPGFAKTPDRHLELNIGSVEKARRLYDALGKALELYDEHEEGDDAE